MECTSFSHRNITPCFSNCGPQNPGFRQRTQGIREKIKGRVTAKPTSTFSPAPSAAPLVSLSIRVYGELAIGHPVDTFQNTSSATLCRRARPFGERSWDAWGVFCCILKMEWICEVGTRLIIAHTMKWVVVVMLRILSRVRGSVTDNNGFWIGWFDLLTLIQLHSSGLQANIALSLFYTFSVHCSTRTRILRLH
jgi:hypothetical protein